MEFDQAVRAPWSDQSSEPARWVGPTLYALMGVAWAWMFWVQAGSWRDGFGLLLMPDAFGEDPELRADALLALAGWPGALWALAWIGRGVLGGPTRVEVDPAARLIKVTQLRRLGSRSEQWSFDQIVSLSTDFTTLSAGRGIDRRETRTYYVILKLNDGTRVRLFGRAFKCSGSSKLIHARMQELMELTDKPGPEVHNVDAREFERKIDESLGLR